MALAYPDPAQVIGVQIPLNEANVPSGRGNLYKTSSRGGVLNRYFDLVLAIKQPIFHLNLTPVRHLTDSDLSHG
jgi:hypothetical protein